MMNNSSYWEKRQLGREQYIDSSTDRALKVIQQQLENAKQEIQNLINDFWIKYASKEGISVAQAYRLADKMDVQKFAKQAQKYVEERNFSSQANEELRLYNLKMKVSRYQLLLNQINLELTKMSDSNLDTMHDTLMDNAKAEVERQAGILGPSANLDDATLEGIIDQPHDNATYMQRWYNSGNDLSNALDKVLRAAIVAGRNPNQFSSKIAKEFEVKRWEAKRLLITETSFSHAQIQKQGYLNSKIDDYVFIAESTACGICKALNDHHFHVKDMTPGTNAEPMHPNCRCGTAPYNESQEDEWFKEALKRADEIKERNKHLGKPSDSGKLTKDEEAAVKRYVSSDSYKINEKLRNDLPLSKQDKGFVENLDYAIDKLPKYTGEKPLYRSLYTNSMSNKEEFLNNLKKGNMIDSVAYTSTSKEIYDPNADIQISIVKSQTGADLTGKNGYNDNEKEILFPRNASFKILDKYFKEGKYYLTVKEDTNEK